jgi:hypothetical protein
MARRRYRSDALSAAGRGIRDDEAAPAGQLPLADAEPSSPQPPKTGEAETKPAHFSSGLKDQLASMRSYAQPDPLDQYIAFHFQGALPNERAWLRANQHHLQNPMLVHHAAQIALQRGVPRQSPEFLQFIGALLDQHHAAAQAPAPPPPHAAHIDIETEHSDSGQPDEEHHMATYVSAPVSRGEAGHAVEPEMTISSIRLTPQEREIARMSGGEELYARNKLKMLKLKKAKGEE